MESAERAGSWRAGPRVLVRRGRRAKFPSEMNRYVSFEGSKGGE